MNNAPIALTQDEINVRHLFVEHFVVNYNYVDSCIAIGFDWATVIEYASVFKTDSYVQKLIYEKAKEKQDNESTQAYQFNLVKRTLIECMTSPKRGDTTRLQAAKIMSTQLGMEAPVKVDQKVEHSGGVIAVPGIADITDWEKSAIDSQTKLVLDTRNG